MVSGASLQPLSGGSPKHSVLLLYGYLRVTMRGLRVKLEDDLAPPSIFRNE